MAHREWRARRKAWRGLHRSNALWFLAVGVGGGQVCTAGSGKLGANIRLEEAREEGHLTFTGLRSLRRGDQDFDQVLVCQGGTDAGALRWIGAVHPFIPGAVHLLLTAHVGDVDGGAQYARLV